MCGTSKLIPPVTPVASPFGTYGSNLTTRRLLLLLLLLLLLQLLLLLGQIAREPSAA